MEGSPRIVKKLIIPFPNKKYLLDCHSFFFFPLKPTFRRILPSFFRVSNGQWRKQTRCFVFLSSSSVWHFFLPIKTPYLDKWSFFLSSLPSGCLPLLSAENSTSPSLSKEKMSSNRMYVCNFLFIDITRVKMDQIENLKNNSQISYFRSFEFQVHDITLALTL